MAAAQGGRELPLPRLRERPCRAVWPRGRFGSELTAVVPEGEKERERGRRGRDSRQRRGGVRALRGCGPSAGTLRETKGYGPGARRAGGARRRSPRAAALPGTAESTCFRYEQVRFKDLQGMERNSLNATERCFANYKLPDLLCFCFFKGGGGGLKRVWNLNVSFFIIIFFFW